MTMSKQHLQPPRGTHDQLPQQAARFRYIEETALHLFQQYGFGEIRTPMFEFTEVFSRNVGDTTDIVTKEMYTFEDRGGESMTLRPEGTAPVVRAFYANGMKQQLPLKLCYVGTPMFRYERPQKGRLRQHHQVGAEIFGIADAMADVELLAMAFRMLKTLRIGGDDLYVQLNSLGTAADRMAYRDALVAYLTPFQDQLSEESRQRLARNPMRILDSKDSTDQALVAKAPKIVDCLCAESKAHFEAVQAGLDAMGIRWQLNTNLVRGLDYYTHTVFEIHSPDLGAQSQVVSGGRYNGLIGQMGGEDVPAIGFGCGVERLEALMPELPAEAQPVALVALGSEAQLAALRLAEQLRDEGLVVHSPLQDGSFKAQFKRANRVAARFTVVIGEDELKNGVYTLKDMATGTQSNVPADQLPDVLAEQLKTCG